MERIVIRDARREDLAQIMELCGEHARFEEAETGDGFDFNTLSKQIFDLQSVECLVVEQGEELVGYATFMQQFSTWHAGFYLYLDCLFLKENLRGKGIGKSMMEEIKKYAKKHHCSIIQWQTPSFNEKAIRFYHRLGASSYSKERFLWKVE